MPRFIISTSNRPSVTLEAPNWLMAMGAGIARLGDADGIERLACETLPNGTVIARDARRGTAYIIREEEEHDLLPDEATLEVEEEPIFAVGDGEDVTDPESLQEAIADALELEDEDTEVVERLDAILEAETALDAWEAALALAAELVPCEAGSALKLTGDERLQFVAAFGEDAGALRGVTLPRGEGIVGFCVHQRLGLLIRDAGVDPHHYDALDQRTGFHTRAVLCAPVALEAALFGCLELLNPVEGRAFERQQLDLISMIADSLAERLGGA